MGTPGSWPSWRAKSVPRILTQKQIDRVSELSRLYHVVDWELDKMRGLAAQSVRYDFTSCILAFSAEVTRLERGRSRISAELMNICTDGSVEAIDMARKAFDEIQGHVRAEAPVEP